MLVAIEQASDGQLRELACAVDIAQNEGIGDICVSLSIDRERGFA